MIQRMRVTWLSGKGIKQGDCLCPLLFNVLMNNIIRQCEPTTKRTQIGNWKMYLQSLVYADDVALIAPGRRELQEAINEWMHAFRDKRLALNSTKSKVMHISETCR